MPTIVTHAIAASAIGAIYRRALTAAFVRPPRPGRRFWIVTCACALLPDADVVAYDLGLEYGHLFGHRGITHSLPFAMVIGAIVAAWLGRTVGWGTRLRLFGYFSLVTASHGLLDALTDEGLGTALFAPFSDQRYFFPWRPLMVAPIGGHGFFTWDVRGGWRWMEVLWSEITWVWLPAAGLVLLAWRLKKAGHR
jgi:inner membrane protein